MATTDFSSSGGQIIVTVGSNDPINYSPSGSTYGFLPNYDGRLQVLFVSGGITVSYIVELADLRVSGAGSAPADEAAALTALDAVWATAQGGGSTTPLEYVANLTQVGTDAPTAVEMSGNTLSGNSLSYHAVGFYRITNTGAFANPVFLEIQSFPIKNRGALIYKIDNDTLEINTFDYSAITDADDVLNNTTITIRVNQTL